MWSPTHIQVTVQRAKGLLTKGKNGTNNCFVTIALGKEKYQTSVKDKADANVSWNEECELKIPDQGNRAELVLTCLHRNNLGIDEFLGQANLPLNEMDVYDRPRSKWFKLQSKPGKEKKNKERGELEVRICFVVKSGSLTDLSKKEKHKSSVGQLASSVGGSLLSIGTLEKRKGIKKFAKSLGSKMHLHSKKKNKEGDDLSFNGSFASIDTGNSYNSTPRYGQRAGEADPGVISEDEDEFVFDNLSHKSSGSSLNARSTARLSGSHKNVTLSNPSPLLTVPDSRLNKGKKTEENHNQNYHYYENNIDSNKDYKNEAFKEKEEESFTLPPPSSNLQSSKKFSFNAKPFSNPRDPLNLNLFQDKSPKAEYREIQGEQITDLDVSEGAVKENNLKPEAKENDWENAKKSDASKKYSSDSHRSETIIEEEANVSTPTEVLQEEKFLLSKLNESSQKSNTALDEWESKLYLDINKSDSLKRNTWQTARVQIPLTTSNGNENKSTTETDSDSENENETGREKLGILKHNEIQEQKENLSSPFVESALIEQKSSTLFLDEKDEEGEGENENDFIFEELSLRDDTSKSFSLPQPKPRITTSKNNQNDENRKELSGEVAFQEISTQREDEIFQQHLSRVNNQRKKDDTPLQLPFSSKAKENLRATENFIIQETQKRPSPKPSKERPDKGLEKQKRFIEGEFRRSPLSNERIIIGHERATPNAERHTELVAALTKKYESKTREDLMLIANGMENEVIKYRQRVKELEDYLDNLLLRVMETHPKILQNPYSRTTSAKSG